MAQIINIHVEVNKDRFEALDLRDKITEALNPLGIRCLGSVNGLDVYYTDEEKS